ncbi:MAG: hypothetical protein LUG50_05225 [Planctomycetaceae bacterium]|nr:hypothetical protein [Planctomycetaceae bacterium]
MQCEVGNLFGDFPDDLRKKADALDIRQPGDEQDILRRAVGTDHHGGIESDLVVQANGLFDAGGPPPELVVDAEAGEGVGETAVVEEPFHFFRPEFMDWAEKHVVHRLDSEATGQFGAEEIVLGLTAPAVEENADIHRIRRQVVPNRLPAFEAIGRQDYPFQFFVEPEIVGRRRFVGEGDDPVAALQPTGGEVDGDPFGAAAPEGGDEKGYDGDGPARPRGGFAGAVRREKCVHPPEERVGVQPVEKGGGGGEHVVVPFVYHGVVPDAHGGTFRVYPAIHAILPGQRPGINP